MWYCNEIRTNTNSCETLSPSTNTKINNSNNIEINSNDIDSNGFTENKKTPKWNQIINNIKWSFLKNKYNLKW